MKILEQITQLKKEKDVTILAHYYQPLEVLKIADYTGDSLGLAKIAANKVHTSRILFAGVRFMAETAAILNPDKTVLLPDPLAGCPLAEYLSNNQIETFKMQYPHSPLVVYVNTTAETKARANVCCTSSNAVDIVRKTAAKWDTETILFGPDKNLAYYVRKQVPYTIITVPTDGNCPHHNRLSLKECEQAKLTYPDAPLLVHPECRPEVQEYADYIGSTAGMIEFCKQHPEYEEFLIGTEVGLVEYLKWHDPDHHYHPVSNQIFCSDMKKNNLQKTLTALQAINRKDESQYIIEVEKTVAQKALISIEQMMEFS